VNKIKFWKSVICHILVCTIYKVFLEYVDLYLTSEWGRFYVGHPVLSQSNPITVITGTCNTINYSDLRVTFCNASRLVCNFLRNQLNDLLCLSAISLNTSPVVAVSRNCAHFSFRRLSKTVHVSLRVLRTNLKNRAHNRDGVSSRLLTVSYVTPKPHNNVYFCTHSTDQSLRQLRNSPNFEEPENSLLR
jgi:hypothetical protein